MSLNPTNISIIKRLLVGRNSRPLRSILTKLPPADLASLLITLNSREKNLLLQSLMSLQRAHLTLTEVPDPHLKELLHKMDPQQRTSLLAEGPEEDCAYFLSFFEPEEQQPLLETLDPQRQKRIRLFLLYPEDSAGRMMHTDIFSVPTHLTIEEALNDVRKRAQDQSIYYIYCTDADNKLKGVVSLRSLVTQASGTKIKDIIQPDVIFVHPESSSEEVARITSHYDFVAIPVLDHEEHLIGVITMDDVLDIIQEQATSDIYARAGLQGGDRVYTSTQSSFKNRLPWMFLNLFLAGLASSVVSLFEETMSQLIILASLKNIVAGLGGNTAIQTLTVVTRGLATGDFEFISYWKAVLKETLVGSSLGLFTGISAGVLVYFWKGNLLVSGVIFLSMFFNSIIASSVGALVPLALKKLGRDPAIGSGVLVTMITDIFGFFSFLGIASLGLKFIGQT